MQTVAGLGLALLLLFNPAIASAQLAVPATGDRARSPQLDPSVTVRTAHLDVKNKAMVINAMIFNASDKKARNIVVECEFWVSHRERYAMRRTIRDRIIPPRFGLQFAIDYGRSLSEPPYATKCGVVKADLDAQ